MLIQSQQLDENQLLALHALIDDAARVDGNQLAFYPKLLKEQRSPPPSLLYYHESELIGFAAVFFFALHECEITLVISPQHRNRGIGRLLLGVLLPLIQQERPVTTLSVSTPKDTFSAFLYQHQFTRTGCEYGMRHPMTLDVAQPSPTPPFDIRLATPADIDILRLIDQACFHTSAIFTPMRLFTLMHDPNYRIFVMVKDNRVIGKAHLAWDLSVNYLSDVGIIPPFQRQGLGRNLVTHCLQHALSTQRSPVQLAVEGDNHIALKLYQNMGFVIHNTIDYWSKPFDELMTMITKDAGHV